MFSDMFGGGFHLWKTLLQQEPGFQECSEYPSLFPHGGKCTQINAIEFGLVRYLHILIFACLQYLFAGEHLDLTAMMNTWTLQKGIPLVTVTRKGPHLLLRQDRFLRTAMPSDPLWSSFQEG